MRVRRARALVCHWSGDAFVVENYRDDRAYTLDVAAAELLDALTDWTDIDQLGERLPGYDPASLTEAIGELRDCGLLLSDHDAQAIADADRDAAIGAAWSPWGVAARHLHFSTRDQPYDNDSLDVRTEIVNSEPPPPLTKRYPDAHRIPLPRGCLPGGEPTFVDVLRHRRTHRSFTTEPVALDTFAALLSLVFGPMDFLDADAFGTVMRRTSACGGSRHEIEAYVVAHRVTDVPAGVYHYQPIEHSLEHIGDEPDWTHLARLGADQSGIGEAAFVVALTGVVERIRFKYRHTGAYRVMLLNAGHLGQTFAMTATALGLGPFQTAALADSDIEHLLGVDGVNETALYLLAAGHPAVQTDPTDRRFVHPPPPRHVRLW